MFNVFGKKRDTGAAASSSSASSAAGKPAVDVQAQMKRVQEQKETIAKAHKMHETKQREALLKAKEYRMKNDTKTALLYLKRAKEAEKQVLKCMNMTDNLESLLVAIQGFSLNAAQLEVTKGATSMLKAQYDAMGGAEALDDVRADYEEVMDVHREYEEAFSTTWVKSEYDDDELLAELDAMAADAVAAEVTAPPTTVGAPIAPLPAMPPVPSTLPGMPAVPTGPVTVSAGTAATTVAAGGAGGDMADELTALEAQLTGGM